VRRILESIREEKTDPEPRGLSVLSGGSPEATDELAIGLVKRGEGLAARVAVNIGCRAAITKSSRLNGSQDMRLASAVCCLDETDFATPGIQIRQSLVCEPGEQTIEADRDS
jgi:hypothetical protein